MGKLLLGMMVRCLNAPPQEEAALAMFQLPPSPPAACWVVACLSSHKKREFSTNTSTVSYGHDAFIMKKLWNLVLRWWDSLVKADVNIFVMIFQRSRFFATLSPETCYCIKMKLHQMQHFPQFRFRDSFPIRTLTTAYFCEKTSRQLTSKQEAWNYRTNLCRYE